MQERSFEKSVLNWNLSSALSSWQKRPEGTDDKRKMQSVLDTSASETPLKIMIKIEVLKSSDREDSFISKTVADAYGRIEGRLVIFETDKGVHPRVGERGYLFLEKDGQRIGYCRPDCIAGIEV